MQHGSLSGNRSLSSLYTTNHYIHISTQVSHKLNEQSTTMNQCLSNTGLQFCSFDISKFCHCKTQKVEFLSDSMLNESIAKS